MNAPPRSPSRPLPLLPLTVEADERAERLAVSMGRALAERLAELEERLRKEIRTAAIGATEAKVEAAVAQARSVFVEAQGKELMARLEALEETVHRKPASGFGRVVSGVFFRRATAGR